MSEIQLIDLWTVQEPVSFEYFQKEKVLKFHPHPDYPIEKDLSQLSMDELFETDLQYVFCREEYDFMRREMSNRLQNYQGNYPIWAWTERPPLPNHFGAGGLELYCFHARVPKDRVLLSSFWAWGCVYGNKSYVALTEEELDAFSKWQEVCNTLYDRERQREAINEVIRKTWVRIFDIESEAMRQYYGTGEEFSLQGVIEEVYENEVVEIEKFISVSAWDEDEIDENND